MAKTRITYKHSLSLPEKGIEDTSAEVQHPAEIYRS